MKGDVKEKAKFDRSGYRSQLRRTVRRLCERLQLVPALCMLAAVSCRWRNCRSTGAGGTCGTWAPEEPQAAEAPVSQYFVTQVVPFVAGSECWHPFSCSVFAKKRLAPAPQP